MKRSTRSSSIAHPTKDAPKLKRPRTKKMTDLTDKDALSNDATPDAADDSEALYAITVREPFATAIVHGPKKLENRKFKLAIPNPQKGRWVAIHAGKSERFLKDGTYNVVRLQCWPDVPTESALRATSGKILGLAHFSSCVPLAEIPDTNVWKSKKTCSNKSYGWIIDRVVPLETPLEHQGQLGLWKVKKEAVVGLWEIVKQYDGVQEVGEREM